MCVCVCGYVYLSTGMFEGQKRALIPLKMELYAAVSRSIVGLGNPTQVPLQNQYALLTTEPSL